MKAIVDHDTCIGCGLCAETCSSVFRMAEDSLAEVFTDPVPPDAEDAATEARDLCPVSAITLE